MTAKKKPSLKITCNEGIRTGVRRRVRKIGGSLMVAIPSSLAGFYGINVEDTVGFTPSGDGIILSTSDGPILRIRKVKVKS